MDNFLVTVGGAVLVLLRVMVDLFGIVNIGASLMGRLIDLRRFLRYLVPFSIVFLLITIQLPIPHEFRVASGFIVLIFLLYRFDFLRIYHACGAVLLGGASIIFLDILFGITLRALAPDFVFNPDWYSRMLVSFPVALTAAGSGAVARTVLRFIHAKRGERRSDSTSASASFMGKHSEFYTMAQLVIGLLITSSFASTRISSRYPVILMVLPLVVFGIIILGRVSWTERAEPGFSGRSALLSTCTELVFLSALVAYIVYDLGRGTGPYRMLFIPLVALASLKPSRYTGVVGLVSSIVFLTALRIVAVGPEALPLDSADVVYLAILVLVWWLIRGFITAEGALRLELRESATIDPLTGVYNLRFVQEFLQELTARERASTYMIILDLDDFKSVNDNFGHAAGDQLLRSVASETRRAVRKEDYIARYGGDEFIVIIRESGTDAAVATALRIGRSLTYRLGNAGSFAEVVPAARQDLLRKIVKPSVSMGMAGGAGLASSEVMFLEADRELYRAKNAGKHCLSFGGSLYTYGTGNDLGNDPGSREAGELSGPSESTDQSMQQTESVQNIGDTKLRL